MEEHLLALPSHTQILQLVNVKVRTWDISREFHPIPKISSAQLLVFPMPGTMKLKITILIIQASYPQESRSDISQLWFGETLARSDAEFLKTSLFASSYHSMSVK